MNEYLLMDGTQIPVSSELAQVVGLNEAIVLQEVYYWCKVNKRAQRQPHDGYYWVWNSYREWQERHFPWWSVNTIRRTFEKLEEKNLIVVGKFSKSQLNQTKWYRINFPELALTINASSLAQNGQIDLLGLSKPITDIIHSDKNENGSLSPQATKRTREYSVENGNGEIDLESFIGWYYAAYRETLGKYHPQIRAEQKRRVIEELTNFLADPDFFGIDAEGLQAMALDFFYAVDSNDWRINHFATRGILTNRYHEIYG